MVEPLLLTVESACERLQLSRSRMYLLLASGEIDSVHVGGRRMIIPDALAAYVAKLIEEQSDGEPRRVEIEA